MLQFVSRRWASHSKPRVMPDSSHEMQKNTVKMCGDIDELLRLKVNDSWSQTIFFFPRAFFLSAVGPPKFRWFKPAKSKGKVHERNPKAQTRGESQRLRALTSLEVDWGWWGRLLVGRGVALGVAEPPRRWPVHPPATRAKKPRRRACRRGRGWLTNG